MKHAAKTPIRKFKALSNRPPFLASVLVFAGTAAIVLVTVYSAASTLSFEVEDGQRTGCVEAISDSNASGSGSNRAVRFGTGPGCPPEPTEDEFTFAVIPDTQVEVNSANNYGRFTNRLQWLADNKEDLNLKYVWQVGDLQDWDDATHSNYVRASNGLQILEDAQIPYALSVGNHDIDIICQGGNPCPGYESNMSPYFRDIDTWNSFYPPSRFAGIKTMCSEFESFRDRLLGVGPTSGGNSINWSTTVRSRCQAKDDTANAYRTFTAGGLKWLLINYEMYPRLAVQEWMKTVIERHADHNVILFTHMFLDGSGNLSTSNGGFGAPQGSPQAVYDNVIKQYANVRFVFSGHTGTHTCRVLTNTVHGNTVHAYLNNRHSTSPVPNHSRLMTINVANRTVTSTMYSPITNQTIANSGSNCNASNVTWVQ